ncbi:MAG: phosphoesterase [Novosphingobium sp.]
MKLFKLAVLGAVALSPLPALAHGDHGQVLEAPVQRGKAKGARQWLAGDHHIHSEFSADYEKDPANPDGPPIALLGRDGRYSIRKNAEMARSFGLSWMVSTDHGGPNHARVNHDLAYPALLESRKAVPEVLQFFGMELDPPNGDHASLIVPHSAGERSQLFEIEKGYSRRDPWPVDPAFDEPSHMLSALRAMKAQTLPPLVFANHPSRSAKALDAYGRYDPAELRDWNDAAPKVAVGMEGAPGHQASALKADGGIDPEGRRGGYKQVPTRGGFDPMTAITGGLWDAMLAEGRRWWITATSDSHFNWREGGNDFWPGEYSKTYVLARKDYADIVDGLRHGRIFVTTGDLVTAVSVDVRPERGKGRAGIGEELAVRKGQPLLIEIRVRDPKRFNAGGRDPMVRRIDLIGGPVTGPASDRSADRAPQTAVIARFTAADWKVEGEDIVVRHRLPEVSGPIYLRVRGTNTDELEPAIDPAGENPWDDLWFYANPVFVSIKP